MIRALYSAASGMTAQQLNVDNIAHNLANANTVGFKTRRAQFQDLLYQSMVQPGASAGAQTVVPAGLQPVDLNVQHVGKPRQRVPVARVHAHERPADPLQREPGHDRRIAGDIVWIVVVQEAVVDGAAKQQHRTDKKNDTDDAGLF